MTNLEIIFILIITLLSISLFTAILLWLESKKSNKVLKEDLKYLKRKHG
jgi:hypothetical protein